MFTCATVNTTLLTAELGMQGVSKTSKHVVHAIKKQHS